MLLYCIICVFQLPSIKHCRFHFSAIQVFQFLVQREFLNKGPSFKALQKTLPTKEIRGAKIRIMLTSLSFRAMNPDGKHKRPVSKLVRYQDVSTNNSAWLTSMSTNFIVFRETISPCCKTLASSSATDLATFKTLFCDIVHAGTRRLQKSTSLRT